MFSSSAEWSRVSNDERTKLGLAVDEEGDFWMTLEDFVVSFTDMSLCHLLKSSWFQLGRSWCEENLFGEWTVGERGSASDRAGGCINHRDTYLRNPQVPFHTLPHLLSLFPISDMVTKITQRNCPSLI